MLETDYRVVSIDPTDGVSVWEAAIKAVSKDDAEAKYLAGNWTFRRSLDEREEAFFDASPREYILCVELWEG